jgi:hypothetical protein
MVHIDLTANFNKIFEVLQNKNMNITGIAKSMGYTTSNQLHSAKKGESMLSTKAIISLIVNANVNPNYLFLGQGEMFITEETELEKLKQENQELKQKLNEAGKMIAGLREVIKKLEQKVDNLIEISSAAIKFHKRENDERSDTGELESFIDPK